MTTATPPPADAFVRRLLATEDPDKRHALIARQRLSTAAAHEVVMRLDAQADKLFGVDPRRMRETCVAALAVAEHAGDDFLRAIALHRFGDARRLQGYVAEAIDCFDKAMAIFTRLGRPLEAARTRIGWVWCMSSLGHPDEALAAARAARRVLAAHGDTYRLAGLEVNTGACHSAYGRCRTALRYFGRGLTLFQSLGDVGKVGAARCHHNRALMLSRLGHLRDALPALEQARALYEELGEKAGYARVMRSLGEAQMDLGRYAAALRAFDEARPIFQSLGMAPEIVLLAKHTADCYLHLNRPEEAGRVLGEVEAGLERIHQAQDWLGVVVRRVAVLLLLGERESARALLDETEQHFPTTATPHRLWLAAQRAAVLLQDGEPAEALRSARDAHRLARGSGMRRIATDALITQGSALLGLGEMDEAERAARSALRLARSLDAAPQLHRAHELLGLIAEARGRPAGARRRYGEAIRQMEREQRQVIFEFRDNFALGREMAFERLAALQLGAGRPVEALATAERAKSRALADAIAGTVELRPRRGMPTAARRLTRELAAAREDYTAAAARAARDEGDGTAEEREGSARTLAELEARVSRLVRRLQLAGAGDDVTALYGATWEAAPPSLPPGRALLEFFISGRDILRFAVDAAGVRGDVLAGAVPEVERYVRAFRAAMNAAERAPAPDQQRIEHVQAILLRLHDHLLAGLDCIDSANADRSLVVVPHGLLHYLPFHALWDGRRYLVERAAVGYAPSAALYEVCRARAQVRTRRPSGALVLAHSAGGRLPFTIREAEAVGAALGVPVYQEEAATRTLLDREGRRAEVIHIAAHGRFRPDAPLFSSIELAGGPLTTADVFSLDLRARLVTLSACETGRAVVGGGDELVGLSRAFLYAGAAGLILSQWRVEDASTAALMVRFYEELTRGVGHLEALRSAQLACLHDETTQIHRAHPFYWAGFQIIGDGHL